MSGDGQWAGSQTFESNQAACWYSARKLIGSMMQFLRELLSQSTAAGSRTNALNHLQWMVAAVLGTLVTAHIAGASHSLVILLSVILVILLVAYLVTHFYFMVKNPDALRSERFTIEKMAIERGIVGDSTTGLSIPGRSNAVLPTPSPPVSETVIDDGAIP